MQSSIILTDLDISSPLKKQLSRGVGPKYVLRSANRIKDSEFSFVKILLVDVMGENNTSLLDKVGHMPNLKLIQSLRAGADSVDFATIPDGVTYCGNVGAFSEAMAEHTMGMILSLAKDLGNRSEKLGQGIADRSTSIFLKNKILGVVGAGGIGQAVSRLAKCLGMKIIGVNTSGRPTKNIDQMYRMSELDLVLKISDVVLISLPLNVKTLHIINRERLQIMRNDCILINVGRGYLIDEKSLYEHLVRNPKFKCGLDVWWHYPSKGEKFAQRFPFFQLPNFLGTPHVSGHVPEEKEIAIGFAIDNIARFTKRRKLTGVIKKEDYLGLRDMISKAEGS